MSFEEQKKHLGTRRSFLRRASCAAAGTLALSVIGLDLRLINSAVAQAAPTGYKALVCHFLNGGNDANHRIVPTDSSAYADYASIRGLLALPQSSLLTMRT